MKDFYKKFNVQSFFSSLIEHHYPQIRDTRFPDGGAHHYKNKFLKRRQNIRDRNSNSGIAKREIQARIKILHKSKKNEKNNFRAQQRNLPSNI